MRGICGRGKLRFQPGVKSDEVMGKESVEDAKDGLITAYRHKLRSD